MSRGQEIKDQLAAIERGGKASAHEKLADQGKLFCRDRLSRLLDEGSFVEDGALANVLAEGLPADGVVTGTGRIDGRRVV